MIIPELATFDFPETDTSCEARFLTNQPGQALEMLNGPFLNAQAKRLAGLLQQRVDQPATATIPATGDHAISGPRSGPVTSDTGSDAAPSTAVAGTVDSTVGGTAGGTDDADTLTLTLQQLFHQVLQRSATDSELVRWRQLNERLTLHHNLDWPERLRLLSLVLLNSNEFLYLD